MGVLLPIFPTEQGGGPALPHSLDEKLPGAWVSCRMPESRWNQMGKDEFNGRVILSIYPVYQEQVRYFSQNILAGESSHNLS
jgi:hypothetical protein